jgi:hypothetical protein
MADEESENYGEYELMEPPEPTPEVPPTLESILGTYTIDSFMPIPDICTAIEPNIRIPDKYIIPDTYTPIRPDTQKTIDKRKAPNIQKTRGMPDILNMRGEPDGPRPTAPNVQKTASGLHAQKMAEEKKKNSEKQAGHRKI